MKNIIFNKFFKDFLKFFLLSSISIAIIVWVIQAVNYLDLVIDDGHGLRVYFLYTALNLPKIFSRILPFIFFISLFLTILRYENNNELIIFWISGIKKIDFVNKLIKFSFVFLLIQLLLNTFINPYTQDLARSFIRSSNIDFFPSLIKERKFIDTVSDLTILIDKKEKNGEMKNIFLKEKFDKNKSQVILAKRGYIVNKEGDHFLILYDGKFLNQNEKDVTIFGFDKTEFNLSKFSTKTTTFPKIQERNSFVLFKCSTLEKKIKFSNFDCQESIVNEVNQELFKRIFLPIYIPLICLIATLVIIYSKDHYKFYYHKYGYFFLGVFSIVVSEITIRYSTINSISLTIFLSFPFFLFTIIYLYLIKKLSFSKLKGI